MPTANDLQDWWEEEGLHQAAAESWREDFQLAISLGVPNPFEWASLASLVTEKGSDFPIEKDLSQCESSKGDGQR